MSDLKKITINGAVYEVTPASHAENKSNPHAVVPGQIGLATMDQLKTLIGPLYFGSNTTAIIPISTNRGGILLALTVNMGTTTCLYYIAYSKYTEATLGITKLAGTYEPGFELTDEGLVVTCDVNWSSGFYIASPGDTF